MYKNCRIIIFFTVLHLLTNLQAKDFNITQYGAVGDGTSINTKAIQTTIDQAHSEGGGRVVIPRGNFVTGSIYLKSNIELHLEKGAMLLGSTLPSHYEKLGIWKSLVLCKDAENVSISGKGTINGSGAQVALHLDSLFHAGFLDSSNYNFVERRPKWYTRPLLLYFFGCTNVKVEGVTLANAACWVQNYERCYKVIINRIRVESDSYWNNDGIDIVDSRNVQITHCYINSSDDGICLKTEDWTNQHKCDSIYIANCTVRSSASAIKFGTSSVNDISNVIIRNIYVFDTYRSAIAIEAAQGGVLENILIENVTAKNTGNALFLRIGQIRNAKKPGTLRNVIIRNVKVTVPLERPDYKYEIRGPALPFFHNTICSSITGLPGYPIQNVLLENITITYPGRGNAAYANMPTVRITEIPELPNAYPEFSMFGELPAWGLFVRHAEGITMKNVTLKVKKSDYRPAVVLDDVQNSSFSSVSIKGDKKRPYFFLHNVRDVDVLE